MKGIEIVEPGVPEDDRLARLVRRGIVRPARSALPEALLITPPPAARAGVSVVAVVLEERRDGR
jgi:hypothetical protein